MKLFVFGLGYSARCFALSRPERKIWGTTRTLDGAAALKREGLDALVFDGRQADAGLEQRLAEADALLVSIPPDERGDPALAHFAEAVAASQWRAIVYLSTVGVYGDHGGAWVDEASETRPNSPRSHARLAAEREWLALGRSIRAPVHVLRLAGIYGPGRNPLVKLREGRATRIVKPGQIFNRIHVADIAQAIDRTLAATGQGGIWNVADDEPAPPQDVVAYAAGLLGVAPPPEIAFESAEMTAMARSFYADNKRVSNAKLKHQLGFAPLYPTYREGLAALVAAGEDDGRNNR